MSKVEWGKKVVCSNCETKFYDLNRKPAVCPKCGTEYIEPTLDSAPTNAKQVFTDEVDTTTDTNLVGSDASESIASEDSLALEEVDDDATISLEEADQDVDVIESEVDDISINEGSNNDEED